MKTVIWNNFGYKIFTWLLTASLFAPLVYSGTFAEFQVPKTLLFYAVVELALPFYLYLCLKFFGFDHLKNKVFYLSAAFLAVSMLSAIFGVSFVDSFWSSLERMQGVFFLIHSMLWLMYLMLLFQIRIPKFNLMANIFISLAVLTSFQGFFQQFKHTGNYIGRASSVFANPIYFAGFLVIPLFLCIYQFSAQKDKRIRYLLSGLMILVGIYSTKTAGALVGVGIGAIVAALVYFSGRYRTKQGMVACVAITFFIALSFLAAAKIPSIKNKFNSADAKDRLVEWRVALRGYKEKPIIGVGPENFSYIADKYFDNNLTGANAFYDKPHNQALEVLTTTGGLGFIVYLGLIIAVLASFYALYKQNQISKVGLAALIGAVTAYHAQNFFAFDTLGAYLTLIPLYAYAARAIEVKENQKVYRKWYSGIWAGSAVVTLFLLIICIRIASADSRLTKAMKAAPNDRVAAGKEFENLSNNPPFIDKARIGIEFGSFLINQPASEVAAWIPKAIDFNKQIIRENPNYYFRNQLFLADLYFLNSQIDGKIDPQLYKICEAADKLAPNRIECDLDIAIAYAYEKKPDQAQAVLDHAKKLAPRQPALPWIQIYVDALGGKNRLVLDESKQIMGSNLNQYNTTQLDKIATYYEGFGNWPQAEALYNDALVLYPQNGYFYVQLAKVYVMAKDNNNARLLIESLKQTNSSEYTKYQSQIQEFLR